LIPPWQPASEWAITPSSRWVRRFHTAISKASITISVVIEAATRHPTTRREKTSMMNAA
jgi:hypothetical protein